MRRFNALILTLTAVCSGLLASDAQAKPRIFGQAEYWSTGKAFKSTEKFYREESDFQVDLGADGAEFTSKRSPGNGGRVGVFFPSPWHGLEWGGSFGYIRGPKLRTHSYAYASVSLPPPPVVQRNLRYEAETTFLRWMLEGRKRLGITRRTDLGLNAAVGLAQGKIESRYNEDWTYLPPLSPTITPDTIRNTSDKWTGFSWEVGPSIAFVGERIGVEFGLVFAGFRTLKAGGDFQKFSWNPIGARLSAEFGPGPEGEVEPSSHGPSDRKFRYFSALEYWTAADAYKDIEDLWVEEGQSWDLSNVSDNVSGGMGARAGAFFSTPIQGFEAGGSIGFVRGPNAKFSIHTEDFSPPATTWDEVDKYSLQFVRILAQARKRFPLSDKFSADIGVGVGVARARLENEYACVVSGSGGCVPFDSYTETDSGLTYEVGPAIVYTGESLNVELGMTYAHFPTVKVTPDVINMPLEFKWNPIGVRVGVEF